MRIARLFAAILVILIVALPASARTWKDRTGERSIEGEFVKLADGQVEIRRTDGTLVQVPLEKFSEDDQRYVEGLTKRTVGMGSSALERGAEKAVETESPRVSRDRGSDSQLRAVVATGYGTTEEDAKANALQNSVQQAIGVLVDALTVIENDKLLSDKLLTYSNGYVEQYRVLSTEKGKGLIVVKIVAQVKVRALSDKLQSLSVSIRQGVDGSSLAAAAVTKGRRDVDAATMLMEIFRGFPANCLALRTGPLRTNSADDRGTTDLTVPVEVAVEPTRYQKFDSALRELLSRMALRQKSYRLVPSDISIAKQGNYWNRFCQPRGVPLYGFLDVEFKGGLSAMHFGKPSDDGRNTFGVGLYDLARSSPRTTSWTVFELGREHFDFFAKRCHEYKYGNTDRHEWHLTMLIKLLDGNGRVLEVQDLLPVFVQSKAVPCPGATASPPVVLDGIRNDPTRDEFWVTVSLDLMNPGMTEHCLACSNMRSVIGGNKTYERDVVPLFSIAPLFFYDLWSNGEHIHSPEVRLAVTFKGLDVGMVEKVRSVECTVSMNEHPGKKQR